MYPLHQFLPPPPPLESSKIKSDNFFFGRERSVILSSKFGNIFLVENFRVILLIMNHIYRTWNEINIKMAGVEMGWGVLSFLLDEH